MISKEIIKIASNTSNVGLNNQYSHKIAIKNKSCGDKITLELIVLKKKILSMKYETESCIYCEAAASLLSIKIKDQSIKIVKTELAKLKSILLNDSNLIFPKRFAKFKLFKNKRNTGRFNCIILPIDAVLKALKK